MTTTTSQDPVDQATLDRITFDTYVDCGRNATTAAKQLGCSPSTVTRRVKRHSLADHGARADKAIASAKAVTSDVEAKLDASDVPAKAARRNAKREGAKARIARLAHTDPNEPRPLVCSVCGKDIATDGVSTGGAYYCPKHAPAQRQPRARTSGSSVTEGPPPRCPGGGQVGLDGPGSTRCPVCTQDAASVRRDGTLGSHKLLRPRQAVTS
jgi:hypothetical protein